jgi:hypothetical protein
MKSRDYFATRLLVHEARNPPPRVLLITTMPCCGGAANTLYALCRVTERVNRSTSPERGLSDVLDRLRAAGRTSVTLFEPERSKSGINEQGASDRRRSVGPPRRPGKNDPQDIK